MAGVAIPPEELSTVIDKTARFVARLGVDFEKKIFENERGNPKFSFLFPNDFYFPYYQKKLDDFRNELGIPAPPKKEDSSIAPPPPPDVFSLDGPSIAPTAPAPALTIPTGSQALAPMQLEIKEELTQEAQRGPSYIAQRIIQVTRKINSNMGYEAPPDIFIADTPASITALDLDIIKLTAQFVARNGHSFQLGIMNREQRNPQFDFLKPVHPWNHFFTTLVESYTRCILPPKGIAEKLRSEYRHRQEILERNIVRYYWEKQREEERKRMEADAERDRNASAMIDWHDFVIVETIDFIDEEIPAGIPPPAAAQPQAIQEVEMETEDMDMEVDEKKPEIKIKKDYVKGPAAAKSVKVQICPKCGQEIPVDEMEQHMKIELLDPKYRVQRQALIERNKVASLATDDEITRNLTSFARRRTDIFGEDEVEIGKSVDEEDKAAKKADKAIWDGHTGSIPTTTTAAMALHEQVAAMYARQIEERNKPAIGPEVPGMTPTPPPPVSSQPLPPPISSLPPIPASRPPPLPPSFNLQMVVRPPMPAMPPGVFPPPFPMAAHPPPPPEVEPVVKRQRIEEAQLMPEEEFLARYDKGQITLHIEVPKDDEPEKPEWKLNGQTISIQVNMRDTSTTIKEKIKNAIGIPPNKQKLKASNLPFMKDKETVAAYNLMNGATLVLGIKERGGKKK